MKNNTAMQALRKHAWSLSLVLPFALFTVTTVWATQYEEAPLMGYESGTRVDDATDDIHILVPGRDGSSRLAAEEPGRTERVKRWGLVTFAKTFLGVPYRLGGEDSSGIDCSAFVRTVFAAFQVQLPRSASEQFSAGRRVSSASLIAGDLVFFRTGRQSSGADHVGIFIGRDKFIHASSQEPGCVRIGELSSAFYRRTFVGAVRPNYASLQSTSGKKHLGKNSVSR